jgi:hypothetical protein
MFTSFSRMLPGIAFVLLAGWGFAAASSPPQEDPASVPQAALADLGFSDVTEKIGIDDYVQLRVALYVPGDSIVLDYCPKGSIWGVDFDNLTKGDTVANVGVAIDAPSLPPIGLRPILFSRKSAGFLGWARDCELTADAIQYRSPLYYVHRNAGLEFAVSPSLTTASGLSPQIRATLKTAAKATMALSGVPAATAAPYLGVLDKGLEGSIENRQQFTKHLFIASEQVRKPIVWTAGNVLEHGKGGRNLDMVLVAQLVPMPAIVQRPDDNGEWQPSYVLNSAFNVGANDIPPGDRTLGGHVSRIATKELMEFSEAASEEAANIACNAVASRVESIGLSDRDAALTIWALAHRRSELGKATTAEVDEMRCLASRWPALSAAGITRRPPTPSLEPPTLRQMKSTAEIDDQLAMFFRSSSWVEQRRYGEALFNYPLEYSDPASVVMRESTAVENVNGWLVNEFERDRPLLARVGCYAYFEAPSAELPAKARGESTMMAIGEVEGSPPEMTRREVLIRMSFSPTAKDVDPRISKVAVETEVPAGARASMLQALGSNSTCRSGYQPKLLFGEVAPD